MRPKEEIINYAKKTYIKRGRPPTIREIERELNLSMRKFYKVFPGIVVDIDF